MNAYKAAKICHEANKALCENLGDFSQVSWELTPRNIQISAVDGVVYKLKNPNVTPEQMHDNWRKFKTEDGWIYGEVKSLEAKTHPCLVPYVKLPTEQRIKDHLFSGIVTSLASFMNIY